MNLDLGKASPLDELRNRSDYFTALSRTGEAQSAEESCPNQDDDGQSLFQGTNQSVFSFETIQTTERLLDRLDLSIEDEMFLQQALQEEREKSKACQDETPKRPTICMHASKFPSLRTIHLASAKEHDHSANLDKFASEFRTMRGNMSSSKVEQHYPAKSRYSYLVEEDTDLDLPPLKVSSAPECGSKYDRPQNSYGVNSKKSTSSNFNDEQRYFHSETVNDVVNFERYRMENSKLLKYYEQLLDMNSKQAKQHDKTNDMEFSSENCEHPINKTPLKDLLPNQNGSSSSIATSFIEIGTLSKPKTESSAESDVSSKTSFSTKDGRRCVNQSTPVKICSSPITGSPVVRETAREPVPPHKTHKKKASFSLKNIFRSPKTPKNKTAFEPRQSFEDNKSTHCPSRTSLESSPRLHNNKLRKFIFPAHPVIHFENHSPTKTDKRDRSSSKHFRSLSDFNQSASNSDISPVERSGYQSNQTEFPRRRLSLDSRKPTKPVSQFLTPPHSRQQSNSVLQCNKKDVLPNGDAAGSATDFFQTHEYIQAAIRMRNEGKFEDFARTLQVACSMGDRTGYLLYGLALRDGCGVHGNYEMSFKYIKAAAGVHSEQEEVFSAIIDPFELETCDHQTDVVPEPTAPALYECGIAYLKGLGFQKPDEMKGLKYLEKAAALGHIDSICLCGTIWSKRSAIRNKDVARAACWFRLAEKRGANLIGSGWIHKKKYLRTSANNFRADIQTS